MLISYLQQTSSKPVTSCFGRLLLKTTKKEHVKTHTLFNLTGRVAIVTGENGGIGRGIAIGLAEASAAGAIFGRHEEKNQRVLGELRAIGNPAIAMNVDVADRNGLEPAIQRVESELGSVEILVNNAGNVSLGGGALLESSEDWDKVIEMQLNAVFLFSTPVAGSMVNQSDRNDYPR